MYPYHNRIKQRIKNGELVGFELVEDYKDIGECLLLHFSTPPFVRPIRPHKYGEYMEILKNTIERMSNEVYEYQKRGVLR